MSTLPHPTQPVAPAPVAPAPAAPPTEPYPPAGAPPAPAAPPAQPEPARPDGVTDYEWAALGDPGKAALVRERARANAAERALAQAQASPPPAPQPAPTPPGKDGQPDMSGLVRDAVAQALAPIVQRDAQREAHEAANRIRESVTAAATGRMHDPTDALAHIDLTLVTDGNGAADPVRITAAIDDLLVRKPHLGQVVDPRRRVDPATGLGAPAGGTELPLDDRVKATLARMQSAAGIRPA